MHYLKAVTNNLDIIAAFVGKIVIIAIVFIVSSNHLHNIYFVAVAVGFICVDVYLAFNRSLKVNNHYEFDSLQVCVTLFGICLVGLSQMWVINVQYSNSLIGLDPWTHMRITTQELDIALNQQSNDYGIAQLNLSTIGGYFSLMHLYLREMINIFGLNYKWTALIFWGSLQTIGTIVFTYLVGKELQNKLVGLLAAFMVSIASWVVFFNEWQVPNGIGATLSLVVAYLIIKAYKTKRYWYAWLSLIFLPIALFTHILVAVWIVGTIACLCFMPLILDCIEAFKSWKFRLKHYHLLPVVLIISLFCWYRFSTVTSAASDTLVTMQTIPAFGQTIQIESNQPQIINKQEDTIIYQTESDKKEVIISLEKIDKPSVDVLNNGDIKELVLDSMGMFLYLGLAIIGVLMMLRNSNLNKSWAILCIGTLLIGFAPSLYGIIILKERWWYLAQVFMAISLAVFLVGILSMRVECYKIVIMSVLVILVVLLSVIGLPSNITNRDLSANLVTRYVLSDKELECRQAINRDLVQQYGGILGADSYYVAYIQSDVDWYWPQRTKVRAIDEYILNDSFKDCPYGIIILRESLSKEPFAFGNGSIYKINYNPIELAQKQGYKKLWSNEDIACLVR